MKQANQIVIRPGRLTDLEQHLDACPECVAFVRTFRSTVTLVQSLREDELPAELRLKLRAFLDGQSRS